MNKIKIAIIMLIIMLASTAYGATYYVNGTSGNDANAGTIGSPWKTVGKANTTLQAGDTVYIRGGTYYISGSAIDPKYTGTAGNVITFSAYNDEQVNMVGASANCIAVNLDSDYGTVRSYIKVHGINFTNFYKHMWILKGDHNEISYCSFIGMYGGTPNGNWRGSTIYRGATYNHIHHCTFGNYGEFTPNDESVVFELGNEEDTNDGTSYNLIENSHIYHGGHHVFGMDGHHNVIRNNYIHNEAWSNYGGTNYGNRVTFLIGYDGDDERNLIEGNRIAYGGECADNEIGGSGGTLASRRHIIRKNMFYQNYMHAYVIKIYSGQGTASDNHLYNNVFWDNGGSPTGPSKDWWNWRYSHGLLLSEGASVQNNCIKNNIFYNNRNYYSAVGPIIETDNTAPDLQTISGNWMEEGDPKFKNISGTPDPDQETQFDFTLQLDSPCIDNGDFLTTITSENGSGTSFVVADAGYFMDGWGIINGDTIQLEGQSTTATITNVDYDTNTIIVDTSLTWTQGVGISLAYNGSAPDQGVNEFIEFIIGGTPQPPQNLRIIN